MVLPDDHKFPQQLETTHFLSGCWSWHAFAGFPAQGLTRLQIRWLLGCVCIWSLGGEEEPGGRGGAWAERRSLGERRSLSSELLLMAGFQFLVVVGLRSTRPCWQSVKGQALLNRLPAFVPMLSSQRPRARPVPLTP